MAGDPYSIKAASSYVQSHDLTKDEYALLMQMWQLMADAAWRDDATPARLAVHFLLHVVLCGKSATSGGDLARCHAQAARFMQEVSALVHTHISLTRGGIDPLPVFKDG